VEKKQSNSTVRVDSTLISVVSCFLGNTKMKKLRHLNPELKTSKFLGITKTLYTSRDDLFPVTWPGSKTTASHHSMILLLQRTTEFSMSIGWYLIPLSSRVSSSDPTTYSASCRSARWWWGGINICNASCLCVYRIWFPTTTTWSGRDVVGNRRHICCS